MKTNYCYWAFATGAMLPMAAAWTGSKSILNRPPPSSCPLLRRMGESESDGESIDYGRDFPRRNNFSRDVDPNINNLPVDLGAVNNLINERMAARESKDFRRADNILNQLLAQHSVIVDDSKKTWKTATKKEARKTKSKRASLPKAKVAFAGNDSSNGSRNNQDFQLSPDAGPNKSTLSEEEIIALIGDRRQAQRDRYFDEADRIRHQLKVEGVYVEDGIREYRWDGVPFGTVRGKLRNSHAASATPRPRRGSLVQSEHSLGFDNDDDADIANDLLKQRSDFKSSGNYEQSDSIRDRLFETYNIRIDDRLGEWSVGGNFGDDKESHWAKTSRDQTIVYTKSDSSADLPSAEAEKYVQSKIDERMRAKRTRNYELSDSIRDELFSRFDVTIHDKINEWSVGGEFGGDNSWNHVPSVKTDEVDEGYGKSDMRSIANNNAGQREDSEGRGSEEVYTDLSRDELSRLTVVQLKEKLRDSGLTVGGTKGKLINRLLGEANV